MYFTLLVELWDITCCKYFGKFDHSTSVLDHIFLWITFKNRQALDGYPEKFHKHDIALGIPVYTPQHGLIGSRYWMELQQLD